MEEIRVIDVKKALRLGGWELVKVVGYRFLYRHPDVPEYLSICGRGYDIVSSELLSLVEHRLGQCLRPVLD